MCGERSERPKALALFSGGLDSALAVKLLLEQGIEVEAVNFTTPFMVQDEAVDRLGEELGVKVHKLPLGEEYLDLVLNPPHGYGSQMNPCIDCRILMLKKAKELAEKVGAQFIVTGEVLDERPFSQRRRTMLLIEREAGLDGLILRPLSAKLLPITIPERRGLVDRKELLAIRGRRRTPQLELAERMGIKGYSTPSGGCLLTDPNFARRLREHIEKEGSLTLRDAELLRVGRHFRINGVKVIVGRNEDENRRLLEFADRYRLPYMEVINYKGPITLIRGEAPTEVVRKAAAITVRYSDAPRKVPVRVRYKIDGEALIIEAEAISERELERVRI